MPRKKKKISNLEVKNDVFNSRFVVDLKSQQDAKNESNKKIESGIIEKIADYDFSRLNIFSKILPFISKSKIYILSVFQNLNKQNKTENNSLSEEFKKLEIEKEGFEGDDDIFDVEIEIDPEEIEETKKKLALPKINSQYFAKFNDLAFFSIFKLLFFVFKFLGQNFYKLCYFVGYSVMFFFGAVRKGFSNKIKLPKIKVETNFPHKIKYFSYKTLKNLNSSLKKIASELVFSVKKIGNIGPAFYAYLTNKVKSQRFKNEVKQRVEKNIEKIELARPKLKKKKKREIRLNPSFAVLRLAIILLLLVTPFKVYDYYKSLDGLKGRVLGASESALANLGGASKSILNMNFGEAGNRFSEAGNSFFQAKEELGEINDGLFVLASFLPKKELKLAAHSKDILAAGENGSKLGENLTKALASFFDEENQDSKLTDRIENFNYYAGLALENSKSLNQNLENIDPDALPDNYREEFIILKTKSQDLENGIVAFTDITKNLKEFLGATEDKRYLLVFQNNTEMRASGGFIGSYALIDFSQGEIKNIEAPGGGSYDMEAGMRELVTAPEPLHLVNPLWHFWDANWWPDWPTTAEKLMWFYEKSDGPTVDGVISFTPTVLERFLEVFGEVDMTEKYGVVLNKDNFWFEVQQITEERPAWHENGEALDAEGNRLNPKEIIGDMMNKIVDELPERLNQNNFVDFLSLMEDVLAEKHVLFYFTDDELEEEVKDRGWDGSIKDTKWDYLSVINTNIAGAKSDKKIKEVINHSAEIMPNGSIVSTLKITRKHTGTRGEPFTGVRNVDWMRIYVPEGSELLEADGFKRPDDIYFEEPEEDWKTDPDVYRSEGMAKIDEESGTKIYNEFNKTVFANWVMVDPGETVTIYLKYKTPIKLEKPERVEDFWDKVSKKINPDQKELYPYAIMIQKQPGSIGSEIKSNLKIPDNFDMVWKYPRTLDLVDDGWNQEEILSTDQYWTVLLSKKD